MRVQFKLFILILILQLILAASAASELGTNIVKNPSFEDGWDSSTNSPKYWEAPPASFTGSLDNSTKYSGEYSYKLTTTSKTEDYSWIRGNPISVEENKTFLVRTHVKTNNVKRMHVKLAIYNSITKEWDESFAFIPGHMDGSSGWKEYYGFIKIPKDVTQLRVILQAGYLEDINSGSATTWFDDIEIIEPDVVNPEKYIDEVQILKGEGWEINKNFSIFLEDTTRESAIMSLVYHGSPIITQVLNKGEYATFGYEKDKLLIFKLDNLFNSSDGGKAWLKEILAGSIPSEKIMAPKPEITLNLPEFAYSGGNVTLNISVINKGEKPFSGDVEVITKLGGQDLSTKENLKLEAGDGKNFSFLAVAPEKPGEYIVGAVLKTKYASLKDEGKILVKVLNPVVTTLSPDLREENGIRGIVTIGSAFADTLAAWDTNAGIEIFRVLENGKERVYSKELPVKSKSFEIAIPYEEFYKDDGRYLVMIKAGEMKSDKFFEIKGPDGQYNPSKGEIIPPTVVSNALYPQLMLLLIGMVAALTVRNHMFPRNWSLPLDLILVGCGAILFIAGVLQYMTEIITKGMMLAGIGFVLLIGREHNKRIDGLLMRGSHIHDFIGLMLMFFSVSYIVLLKPEWNTIMIAGTLIIYYTLINLHGERNRE
ncbi:MAG: hypothetical protein WA130_18160 [Candidatus Methanoperedens sp.]